MANKPTTPPVDEDQLHASIAQLDRAVDAVYVMSNATARLILLEAPDVPRLCVSAGLRAIEKMVEHYARRLEQDATGLQTFELREKVKLQQILLQQCKDFTDVTAEAMETVKRIQEGIHKTGNLPAEKPM